MTRRVWTPTHRITAARATLLVIAVSAVALFAVSAQASTRHAGRTVATSTSAVSAVPTPAGSVTFERSAPQGGVSPQVGIIINCSVSIDNPHNSSHVGGTVNVVSHVGCDHIVDSISITTRLYRAGIQVASKLDYRAGWYSLDGNAAVSCLTASYGGKADATIVAPPGYSPPYATAHVESPVVGITC